MGVFRLDEKLREERRLTLPAGVIKSAEDQHLPRAQGNHAVDPLPPNYPFEDHPHQPPIVTRVTNVQPPTGRGCQHHPWSQQNYQERFNQNDAPFYPPPPVPFYYPP